jgi:hypothetical protein
MSLILEATRQLLRELTGEIDLVGDAAIAALSVDKRVPVNGVMALAESMAKIPKFDDLWSDLRHNSSDHVQGMVDIWDEEDYLDETGLDADDDVKKYHAWLSEKVESEFKTGRREAYDDIVYEYRALDGESCWREMTVGPEYDPRTAMKLGVYWSIDEDAADAHWGDGGRRKVLYQAKIDLSHVDWSGTMLARLDPDLGDIEKEIRFIPGSRVFVERVKVTLPDRKPHWLVIQDWREM